MYITALDLAIWRNTGLPGVRGDDFSGGKSPRGRERRYDGGSSAGTRVGNVRQTSIAAPSPDVASSMGFNYGFMAVLFLFLLPSTCCFARDRYDAPDSFAAFKIHPATYLTAFGLMATLLAVLQRKPVTGLAEWRVPVIFVLLTVLCAMCSFLSVGTAGASNYIDTFVAAGALAMILATGDIRQRRRLGYVIMALVLFECSTFILGKRAKHTSFLCISARSILEKWEGRKRLPSCGSLRSPTAGRMRDVDGRVVASFDAPAPMAFRGGICLPCRRVVQLRRPCCSVHYIWHSRRRRRHFSADEACQSRTNSAYPQLHTPCRMLLPLLLGVLGSQTSIGNRVVTHFYVDDSAMVRAQQWDVLDLLDRERCCLGHRDRVDQMSAQIGLVSENSGIENPWLLLFLNLGVINLIPFLFGLSMFLVYLARIGGWPNGWVLIATYPCRRIDKQLTGYQDFGSELPCCLCVCDERLQKSEGRHQQ